MLSSVVISGNVGDQGGGGLYNEGTLRLIGSTVRVARPQDGDRDGAAVCDIGAYELVRR